MTKTEVLLVLCALTNGALAIIVVAALHSLHKSLKTFITDELSFVENKVSAEAHVIRETTKAHIEAMRQHVYKTAQEIASVFEPKDEPSPT